jgi:hypothetical protein
MTASPCTDPVIGDILAGWRYDISGVSPDMRTDYEQHLTDCTRCRHRQRAARTIDFLLLTVSTLSIAAFLLATAILHRIETLAHLGSSFHAHLRHTAITVSLEGVAIAGLLVSILLWTLVAVATPLPGLLRHLIEERIPENVRERLLKSTT